MRGQRPNWGISIHALLAESDYDTSSLMQCQAKFLSTLSLRRATVHFDNFNLHCVISIHALLAESDHDWPPVRDIIQWISIHALLAESDLLNRRFRTINNPFLSTLSLRRATTHHFPALHNILISIHALLAESDIVTVGLLMFSLYFYPRSPCGERQAADIS